MESKNDKKILILLVLVAFLLLCNVTYSLLHLIEFSKQKQSGNDRWLQVENRILQVEEKVEKYTKEV